MTPNLKRNTLFLLAGIVAVAACYAVYLYNKGPVNVKNATGIKVSAVDLYHAWYKDSLQAVQKFSNRVVETNGVVAQVSKNQQNQTIVFLMTNETGAFINCTLEDSLAVVKEDETILIKGICTGIGMTDVNLEILGDVYLTRCYIMK
ncbi:MAG: hypothetical protein IPL84_04295 [Chitinophagaceae bacterium]|nr:hypothetical protein [Chitinophagaceae bacterium]